MCGVSGIVSFASAVDRRLVERMAQAISHRGPDAQGVFASSNAVLVSVRLAILDASEQGAQPMASDDGRYQLIFNGMIYNHVELREALKTHGHRFRGHSDTEVVLAAYRQWGTDCVTHFNGMWGFALWDTQERRLFCSRDRFGIKPFYYRATPSRLQFASELKAFAADREAPLGANLRLVRDYLEHERLDHTADSFFAGISALPPAHSMTFDVRGLRIERYWTLNAGQASSLEPHEEVRDLVFDAVRLALRTDAPYGMSLSGGLDSSTITCAVAQLQPHARPRTFTAAFDDPGFNERPYAEAVVGAVSGAAHWVSFTAADLVRDLDAIVWTQDSPFNSSSIAAQWYVMKAARAGGMKVMLDGQGSDEVFAGYAPFIGYRFVDLLRQGRVGEFRRQFAAYRHRSGIGVSAATALLIRPFISGRLEHGLRSMRSGAHKFVHASLRDNPLSPMREGAEFPDRLRSRLWNMFTGWGIPELLHSLDRNSMAHSIEARVPFLDHRLVEKVFSMDGDQLISDGHTKAVLRRAVDGIVPDAVLQRRDKLTYMPPEGRFFREELGAYAADIFHSRSFVERGWSNAAAVQRRLADHRSGKLEAGFELWRALSLELWARSFLDQPAPLAA
ncbi:asparagine synthase (glutamine-hydrolyzing) [Pelomonas sp. SE-A7]|uniref:asparagine synthase (glutamine-hydrolyzing) n=1 Tax=Pelomonas sp. SE-A7 TaxID=3054953 RepID=UPI00259CDE82|nr:asparagine synthase (glutamine-hydrolyzing) [Pelomonas sp. SE-A7]MDM4764470.1 asparagine synthase (glutamine-hydrolyzing) [Pelomonas sp. SE-A7]